MSQPTNPIKLAIFASGAGSNAANIIKYFDKNPKIQITAIVGNNPDAGVWKIADNNHIEKILLDRTKFLKDDGYVSLLKELGIDYIILAGFLWKVPVTLVTAFPNKIINIHPALLPKYGGKGMYGAHVHEAVVAHKEQETGISIHMVDEIYDNGKILFQAKCPVSDKDTPEDVAAKVHALEYKYFPEQIELFILGKN